MREPISTTAKARSMPSRVDSSAPTLSRRHLLAGGGMFALGRSLAAAQTPVPTQPKRRRSNLRIGVGSLPPAWDPLAARTLEHLWLTTLLYDSLGRWNIDGAIIPALGLGWSTASSGRVLEIALRPDAISYGGKALTADDVRHALDRARRKRLEVPDGWRLEHVVDVETPDAQSVRIILDAPDAALVASLAAPALSIVPADVDAARLRGGTGPFRMMVQGGNSVLLQRNPYFWQIGRPHFDLLHVRAIPDDTARSTALVTGVIDLMPDAPLLDIPMLQADPSIQLVGGSSNHLCLLQVNLARPAMADVRVRRVLASAIDRRRLVKVAAASQGEATSLLFPAGSWAAGDSDEVSRRSAAETRAALAELGVRTDLRLRLLADNSDATLANTAVVLQEQLASCGIALSIDLEEGARLQEAIRDGEFDVLAAYTRPWRDPHELVRPLLASDGTANRSGYAVAAVDQMIRSATLVTDRARRRERYAQVQRRILDDVPVIVLFRPHYFDAMSRGITGYAPLTPVTARGLLPARADGV